MPGGGGAIVPLPRHIDRLKTAGLWFRDRPLFPDSTGATWGKSSAILLFLVVRVYRPRRWTTLAHQSSSSADIWPEWRGPLLAGSHGH